MAQLAEREVLVASLRDYLEDLLETGIEDLPFGGELTVSKAEPVAAAEVPAAPAESPVEPASPTQPASSAGPASPAQPAADPEAAQQLLRGAGNPGARLAFVMNGAGYQGEAGELLAKMVQAMGFATDEVYLISFDDATPPSRQALLAALHKVNPEAVVALGALATELLLDSDAPLREVRGCFSALEGAPVMPTWHPEVLVNNPGLKRDAWNDLQQVMRLLGKERN